MELVPSITKTSSLISQEEKQREVSTMFVSSESQAAFAVQQSKNGKKDRPLCSHCGLLGHIKEKCFKQHGYPPNYKKGAKSDFSNSVHQVSHSDHGQNTETASNLQLTPQ